MFYICSKPKVVNKKARIFFRDSKTEFIDIDYKHLFCSKGMGGEEAEKLKSDLETNSILARENAEVEIKPYGKTKNKVVQVSGPIEIGKFLPGTFRTVSSIDLISWTYPVFSKFSPTLQKSSSLENLERILQEQFVAEDTEASTEGRRDGNFSELTTFSKVWKNGSDVKSILNEKTPNSEILLKAESDEIMAIDPLIIDAHNAKYDLLDVRGKHKGKRGKVYTIGVDGSEPVSKGITGFLEIPYVAGRQVLCSLAFAQNWLWSVRNNLPTVVRFYGQEYSKKLEGAENIEVVTERAKRGDKNAREILEQYCLEDCFNHEFLYKKMLPTALELAYAFETDLTSICFRAKSRNAMKLREKRYFQSMNTFRKNRQKEMQDFDIVEARENLLKSSGFSYETKRGFSGKHEAVFIAYLNLFPNVLKESLESDQSIKRLYAAIETADTARDKVILSQGLDAFSEEIIFDLNSTMPDYVYETAYHMSRTQIRDGIKKFTNNMQEFLNKYGLEIMNYSQKFVVVKSKHNSKNTLEELQNCGFFIPLGIADWTISGSSGRAIAKVEDNVLGMEWDYMGRRGLKTGFERQTLLKIIDTINSSGPVNALKFCAEQYKNLMNGNVRKEELLYETAPREELEDYTPNAQRTRRYSDLDDLDVEKNEKVSYGYAKGYSKPLPAEEFLKPEIIPDIKKYMKYMFGKLYSGYEDEYDAKNRKKPRINGTIGDIVLALAKVQSGARKPVVELTEFLEGEKNILDAYKDSVLYDFSQEKI